MTCKLCKSKYIEATYKGLIRDGGLGKYTNEPVTMWKCNDCGVIWHESLINNLNEYYESQEYRDSLEGGSEDTLFYKLHDKETLNKFQYTGTEIFRGKIISDIGCGCGAFLDFLQGVVKNIVAIEPSEIYRQIMRKKGFETYAYIEEAKSNWSNKIDIITSFDVIEHVEEPKDFMKDIYDLLSDGGQAIIGTPTEAPIMRKLLGEIYEKKLLFSTQHIWIFSEKNLRKMAIEIGFKKVEIKYFQRYGIGNLLGWLREKEPCSDIEDMAIFQTLDAVWKSECSENEIADYIVLYVHK